MAPDADGGVMDCFNKNVLKSWAGLEHWKFRKCERVERGLCRSTSFCFIRCFIRTTLKIEVGESPGGGRGQTRGR